MKKNITTGPMSLREYMDGGTSRSEELPVIDYDLRDRKDEKSKEDDIGAIIATTWGFLVILILLILSL